MSKTRTIGRVCLVPMGLWVVLESVAVGACAHRVWPRERCGRRGRADSGLGGPRPRCSISTVHRYHDSRMTHRQPDLPDAPACPFLGLEADPRTRFTFPHPGHRCHAGRRPSAVEQALQARYCLSPDYAVCERFRASVRPPGMSPSTPPASAQSVVHVFRAGESLGRIASVYGVTVEQLVRANNLAGAGSVEDGFRLVIPLDRPRGSGPAEPRFGRYG